MKIYNKKGFFTGLFWLGMSAMALILMSYKGMNIRDWLMVVIGLILGIHGISRSLSKNASLEDQDELTTYLLQKSRSMAYTWTKIICIGLMVFYIMLFSHTKHEIHLTLVIAFGMMLVGMLIVEGITEIICTHKIEKSQ